MKSSVFFSFVSVILFGFQSSFEWSYERTNGGAPTLNDKLAFFNSLIAKDLNVDLTTDFAKLQRFCTIYSVALPAVVPRTQTTRSLGMPRDVASPVTVTVPNYPDFFLELEAAKATIIPVEKQNDYTRKSGEICGEFKALIAIHNSKFQGTAQQKLTFMTTISHDAVKNLYTGTNRETLNQFCATVNVDLATAPPALPAQQQAQARDSLATEDFMEENSASFDRFMSEISSRDVAAVPVVAVDDYPSFFLHLTDLNAAKYFTPTDAYASKVKALCDGTKAKIYPPSVVAPPAGGGQGTSGGGQRPSGGGQGTSGGSAQKPSGGSAQKPSGSGQKPAAGGEKPKPEEPASKAQEPAATPEKKGISTTILVVSIIVSILGGLVIGGLSVYFFYARRR